MISFLLTPPCFLNRILSAGDSAGTSLCFGSMLLGDSLQPTEGLTKWEVLLTEMARLLTSLGQFASWSMECNHDGNSSWAHRSFFADSYQVVIVLCQLLVTVMIVFRVASHISMCHKCALHWHFVAKVSEILRGDKTVLPFAHWYIKYN